MRPGAPILTFAENLIVQTASYPPLQKTQERGTHGGGGISEIKSLGHPSVERASGPREIPPPAGENAGVRDDALQN